MDTNYRLYIYKRGETDKVLISSEEEKGNKNYSIRRLAYKKGLYAPNSVEIEINVSGPLSNNDITAAFASKSADLSVCAKIGDKDVTQEICTDYIVYQFRIVSESSTRTVHLTLFSRDKLLTLDKFSRVYLNQRLGLNIIEDSLRFKGEETKQGFLKGCKVEVLKDKTGHLDITRLQFLYYEKGCFADVNEDSMLSYSSFEAIQPYRVQYNEDFHQFISRVACQCGEMLFFEDGKLTLGPDPSDTTPTKISDADIYRIEYPSVENSKLTVKDYHRDFFKGDDAVLEEKDGLQYSDCAAFDEYYDILNEDKLPDSKNKEFYWPDIADLGLKTLIPAIGIAAASSDATTASEKIAKAVKEGAAIEGRYATSSDYVNKKYTENVFKKASEKTSNCYQANQQKFGKDLCQFADVFSDGQLKHGKLADIRELEMRAEKHKITVQVKTSSFAGLKLKLGSRVMIGLDTTIATSDDIYVVTACRGNFLKDGSDEKKDITEIEIVPLQQFGNKIIFVPPYNKCADVTPVQPQTAIVSDAADPRLLGRVRVRYPWQVGKLGSPWVRVLTPFSTANGDCIHFQPKVGDEVMIGYVGGNIERPYVIGSLFGNDRFNIHDSLFSPYNSTIKVGSQRLDFREGSLSSYASLFSGWKFASQFIPGIALNMKTKHSSDWHGITRLTDANSFWKIEGNTAARAITIDSAWGKVTISAYTGINIEAVGDVTIKGNNINIKAQNNVTIESGLALKNARKSHGTSWGGVAGKVAADFIGDFVNFDLSFLRTIWESIVPPKEGTLKIKSNRYLMLEAGKGAAYDSGFVTDKNGQVTSFRRFAPKSDVMATSIVGVKHIFNAIARYSHDVLSGWDLLRKEMEVFQKVIESVNATMKEDNKFKSAYDVVGELKESPDKKVEALSDYVKLQNISSQAENKWKIGAKALLDKFSAYREVQTKGPGLKGDVAGYNEELSDGLFSKGFTDESKTELYQSICKKYLESKGFKFGTEEDRWDDKVKGLSYISSTPKTDFLKDVFKRTADSFYPGSDYIPAYTDKGATSLLDGEIIVSSRAETSVSLKQDGTWFPNENATLASLKKELVKTFSVHQPVVKRIDENINDPKNVK